jgi:hypothetical protein
LWERRRPVGVQQVPRRSTAVGLPTGFGGVRHGGDGQADRGRSDPQPPAERPGSQRPWMRSPRSSARMDSGSGNDERQYERACLQEVRQSFAGTARATPQHEVERVAPRGVPGDRYPRRMVRPQTAAAVRRRMAGVAVSRGRRSGTCPGKLRCQRDLGPTSTPTDSATAEVIGRRDLLIPAADSAAQPRSGWRLSVWRLRSRSSK